MEDEQIVYLLFSRSEAGLEETAGKYGRLLLSITSGILCNDGDAEECVNDTYLKIWNIIPPYRPTHFRSFLCKITRQPALDRYRTAHSKKANAEKGNGDISGVFGGTLKGTQSIENITVYFYTMEDLRYAIWQTNGMSYCYYASETETNYSFIIAELISATH